MITMQSRVLSEQAIRQLAPSAFAEAAHISRSARYTYIPTSRIIDEMRNEGFSVVGASQSRSRDPGRRAHTKHLIRFARVDQGVSAVGDSIAQVCLINSHDGTSAYQLMAGLFRLVCLNGLIVSDGTVEALRVPHAGDVVGRVIEGSYEVMDGANRASEVAGEWRSLTLDPMEQHAFADAALRLRWEPSKAPITTGDVLQVRRQEDRPSDLWTTFNRTQEALLNGGQRTRNENGRRGTVRAIRGIEKNVALNRALWQLAENMAKIKKAA